MATKEFAPKDCFTYHGKFFVTPAVKPLKGMSEFCPDLNTFAREIVETHEKKLAQIQNGEYSSEQQRKLDLDQEGIQYSRNLIQFEKICNLSQVQWNESLIAPRYDDLDWKQKENYFSLYTPIYANDANTITLEEYNAKLKESFVKKQEKEKEEKPKEPTNRKFTFFTQDADGNFYDGVKMPIKDAMMKYSFITNIETPPHAVLVVQGNKYCWCIAHPQGGYLYMAL